MNKWLDYSRWRREPFRVRELTEEEKLCLFPLAERDGRYIHYSYGKEEHQSHYLREEQLKLFFGHILGRSANHIRIEQDGQDIQNETASIHFRANWLPEVAEGCVHPTLGTIKAVHV